LGFPLKADWVCESIFDLSGPELAAQGLTLLLADLDNTLVPYGVPLPTDPVRAWNEGLKAAGVTLFVLSNNRHEDRPRVFSQALGVPFLGHAGKPKRGGFVQAMEQMGATVAQTAIVGDQIFTDILGGNRAGVTTILVQPIRLAGNPGRYVRYAVELPFRALSGHGRRGVRP
jgi:hypothetical protein